MAPTFDTRNKITDFINDQKSNTKPRSGPKTSNKLNKGNLPKKQSITITEGVVTLHLGTTSLSLSLLSILLFLCCFNIIVTSLLINNKVFYFPKGKEPTNTSLEHIHSIGILYSTISSLEYAISYEIALKN